MGRKVGLGMLEARVERGRAVGDRDLRAEILLALGQSRLGQRAGAEARLEGLPASLDADLARLRDEVARALDTEAP